MALSHRATTHEALANANFRILTFYPVPLGAAAAGWWFDRSILTRRDNLVLDKIAHDTDTDTYTLKRSLPMVYHRDNSQELVPFALEPRPSRRLDGDLG